MGASLAAERMRRIKPSPSSMAAQRARELKEAGHDIISLTTGEPDADTPAHIIDAALAAMRARRDALHGNRRNDRAEAGDRGQVSPRERARLRAVRGHGLYRRQAGDLQRAHVDDRCRRRGRHPDPLLGVLSRYGAAGRRDAPPGALRSRDRLQDHAGSAGSGSDAADPLADAELAQQSVRRRLLGGRAESARRGARSPSACAGADGRHVRAYRVRRRKAGHHRRCLSGTEGPDADP